MNATILTDRFDWALLDATHVHGGQTRNCTRIPNIAHLMAVTATVLDSGGSEATAITGPLYDAIEDQSDEDRLTGAH